MKKTDARRIVTMLKSGAKNTAGGQIVRTIQYAEPWFVVRVQDKRENLDDLQEFSEETFIQLLCKEYDLHSFQGQLTTWEKKQENKSNLK